MTLQGPKAAKPRRHVSRVPPDPSKGPDALLFTLAKQTYRQGLPPDRREAWLHAINQFGKENRDRLLNAMASSEIVGDYQPLRDACRWVLARRLRRRELDANRGAKNAIYIDRYFDSLPWDRLDQLKPLPDGQEKPY